MSNVRTVLSLLAHPDDAEFTCAGTLALLGQRGWQIHIATMTPGDCGSASLGPEEISAIRRREGAAAAAVLQGAYHCLESRDCFIRHDPPTLLKAVELIRQVRPSIVFAASPADYLCDHEITSTIVRDAVFWSGVPNISIKGTSPLRPMPHLYYVDAMECKDILGRPIEPAIVVEHQHGDRDQGRNALLPCQPARMVAQAAWDGRVRLDDEGGRRSSRQAGRLRLC